MERSTANVPQSGVVFRINIKGVTYSINIVSWLCSSETGDFCVSVFSRYAITMSVSPPSPMVFSGSEKLRQQKEAALDRWQHDMWVEQVVAQEWFLEEFLPCIQERVRPFLHPFAAEYLHLRLSLIHI